MAEQKALIAMGTRGIELTSFDSLYRFAECVAQSGLAPKGMEKPQAIAVAIEAGLEIGLTAMSALQNIAVINGRPALWGDSMIGLVLGSGLCESFSESFEGEKGKDNYTAICTVKRVGMPEAKQEFSIGDAKQAGLWGKPGPWSQYPYRMLKMRARGFALRDNFADVLKGLRCAEEVRDIVDITDECEIKNAPKTLSEIAREAMEKEAES